MAENRPGVGGSTRAYLVDPGIEVPTPHSEPVECRWFGHGRRLRTPRFPTGPLGSGSGAISGESVESADLISIQRSGPGRQVHIFRIQSLDAGSLVLVLVLVLVLDWARFLR